MYKGKWSDALLSSCGHWWKEIISDYLEKEEHCRHHYLCKNAKRVRLISINDIFHIIFSIIEINIIKKYRQPLGSSSSGVVFSVRCVYCKCIHANYSVLGTGFDFL